MRNLLVLAGNSLRNRQWGEACATFFGGDFDEVFFPHYEHWTTGVAEIDLDVEMEKIKEIVKNDGNVGEWYIYAKSIGSVLVLKACQHGFINPKKCVFFGMPLNIAAANYGADLPYLSAFTVPTLAFHNTHDPVANYGFVVECLSKSAPTITLRTIEDDTHDYLDFVKYEDEIKLFSTT